MSFCAKVLGRHRSVADPDRKLIEFFGVWDTVDAVGSPFGIADLINSTVYRFKFPSNTLSGEVAYACHALALDEPRQSFEPPCGARSRRCRAHRAGVVCRLALERRRRVFTPGDVARRARLDDAQGRGPWSAFLPQHRRLYRDGTDVDDKLVRPAHRTWDVLSMGAARCRRALPGRTRRAEGAPNGVSAHRAKHGRVCARVSPPTASVVTTSTPEAAEKIRRLRRGALTTTAASSIERERLAHLLGKSAYWLMIADDRAAAAMIRRPTTPTCVAIPSWRDRARNLIRERCISANWFAVTARTAWHYPWFSPGATAGALDEPARRSPSRRQRIRSSGISCGRRCERSWSSGATSLTPSRAATCSTHRRPTARYWPCSRRPVSSQSGWRS